MTCRLIVFVALTCMIGIVEVHGHNPCRIYDLTAIPGRSCPCPPDAYCVQNHCCKQTSGSVTASYGRRRHLVRSHFKPSDDIIVRE